MKVLPSSMRLKRRYLRFKVISPVKLTRREMADAILSAGVSLFGDHGMSLINLHLVEFDESSMTGIIRCNRDKVDEARAIIATVSSIKGEPAGIRVLRVSGTLKGVRR